MTTTQVGVAAHIIKRPRLTKILDETEARIILLCAPAGYGKTTLAREWVATRDEPVLWYSGGPAMADVAAFAVDSTDILSDGDRAASERIKLLAASGASPSALGRAVGHLTHHARLLVVDDYHHAAESPEAEQFFGELILQLRARILVTSRIRPRWASPRSVLYGDVHVLLADNLRFTPDEAEDVLPGAAQLQERANGWPVLLGLASLQGRDRIDEGFDQSELYEFFAGELFDSAPAELQRSLIAFGAGADASRDVARAALGAIADSHAREAIRRGLAGRGDDGWVVFHPLLRDFLLRRLMMLDEPSRDAITRGVAHALASNRRWHEIAVLLEAAGTEGLLVEMLRRSLPELLRAGRIATLRRFCSKADELGCPHPIVLLASAECALREGRAADALALATAAAPQLDGDEGALAHLSAARAAHLSEHASGLAEHCRLARGLARSPALIVESIWVDFVAAYERAPGRIAELYEELRNVADPSPTHQVRLASAAGYMLLESAAGPRAAMQSLAQAHGLLSQTLDPLRRTSFLHIFSYIASTCGEYERALALAAQLEIEATESGLDFVLAHTLLMKARALIGLRRLGEAGAALREVEASPESRLAHVQTNGIIVAALAKIAAGDLAAAAILLDHPPHPEAVPALQAELLAHRALVAAALGRRVDAERCTANPNLSRFREARVLTTFTSAILEGADAVESVEAALRTAFESGHADAVVTTCRAAPYIARAGVVAGLENELKALFTASRDFDLARHAGISIPREHRRGSRLTSREMDVLELMVSGLSNVEIARTLFISHSTAKVHVRHIFEKLGVHSRAEAAARWPIEN